MIKILKQERQILREANGFLKRTKNPNYIIINFNRQITLYT